MRSLLDMDTYKKTCLNLNLIQVLRFLKMHWKLDIVSKNPDGWRMEKRSTDPQAGAKYDRIQIKILSGRNTMRYLPI